MALKGLMTFLDCLLIEWRNLLSHVRVSWKYFEWEIFYSLYVQCCLDCDVISIFSRNIYWECDFLWPCCFGQLFAICCYLTLVVEFIQYADPRLCLSWGLIDAKSCASWCNDEWLWKENSIVSVSEAVYRRPFKLCVKIAPMRFTLFIPVSVTLTYCQGQGHLKGKIGSFLC